VERQKAAGEHHLKEHRHAPRPKRITDASSRPIFYTSDSDAKQEADEA